MFSFSGKTLVPQQGQAVLCGGIIRGRPRFNFGSMRRRLQRRLIRLCDSPTIFATSACVFPSLIQRRPEEVDGEVVEDAPPEGATGR